MTASITDDGFDLETDEYGIYRDVGDPFSSFDSGDKGK